MGMPKTGFSYCVLIGWRQVERELCRTRPYESPGWSERSQPRLQFQFAFLFAQTGQSCQKYPVRKTILTTFKVKEVLFHC